MNLLDEDRLDFAAAAKQLDSCPENAYRARFGDADWEQHFEI